MYGPASSDLRAASSESKFYRAYAPNSAKARAPLQEPRPHPPLALRCERPTPAPPPRPARLIHTDNRPAAGDRRPLRIRGGALVVRGGGSNPRAPPLFGLPNFCSSLGGSPIWFPSIRLPTPAPRRSAGTR